MVEIEPTRSGTITAIVKGIHLHSLYDPVREADRFLEGAIVGKPPGTFLLLGAGLGFLVRAIQLAYPSAKLIALYYEETIYHRALVKSTLAWYPGRQALLQFLRKEVTELDTEGLKIIEWPPSSRIFPNLSRQVDRAVHQVVKELRGNLVTTANLGRRWLRNSMRNFLSIEQILQLKQTCTKAPILIAASGPSLVRAADFIRSHRLTLHLWALPSAVMFLESIGCKPDLIVMTDSSYYAMRHLHPCSGTRIAMPLSASPGIWRKSGRALLLSQDTFFERALLRRAGIHCPIIHSHGTVAATALDLALLTGKGKIIFSGLDFCYQDILAHARPNSFEYYLQTTTNRYTPLDHLLYGRAVLLAPEREIIDGTAFRSNLALKTYAGWFSVMEEKSRQRLLRFEPLKPLAGIRNLDLKSLKLFDGAASASTLFHPAEGYPSLPQRRIIVQSLFNDWRERLEGCLVKLVRDKNLSTLFSDTWQVTFSYFLDSAALLAAKRTWRLEGESRALQRSKEFIDDEIQFLKDLAAKFKLNEEPADWKR